MLPPDFRWHSVGTASFEEPNALLLDSIEVLRLNRRVDGTWWVSLNNQRDWKQRKQRDCSSYEQGKTGAELWAARHQNRLRAVDERIKELAIRKPFLMR